MGQLTHSTRNVLFNPLVSKDASNTILFVEESRSYARARARVKNGTTLTICRRSTRCSRGRTER